MDKETLSNYGWIVVLVLILAVMLALASPFGSFIAGAIKSTTAGLFDVNQAALGSAGIDVNDMVFENCDHLETEIRNATDTYTGDTCCKACGAVLQAGQTIRAKVPEGGKYTAADGTIYGPGEEMPEVVTNGDVFTVSTHHYKYTYETESNGWKVAINTDVVDKKQTSYGAIYTSINGEPITNMHQTFSWCTLMKTAPEIPDTVTNMHYTFQGCHELVVSPVIPDGVTNMFGTFWWCGKLTTAPQLPSNLVNFYCTFANCTSLKTYVGSTAPDGDFSNYKIPDGVTNMGGTFGSCSNLTHAPKIPNKVTDLEQTFSHCKALVAVPDLSEAISVKNMGSTFDGCKSLTNIDDMIIPETTTSIQYIFQGCTGITDASKLIIPNSVVNICSAFRNCTNLKTAPVMPQNAYKMYDVFENCTSLTGTIIFNTKFSETIWAKGSMAGVDFEAQKLTLAGSSTYLDGIGETGINYCRECNGKHKDASKEHVCHGGVATCQSKANCVVCGSKYGDCGACVVENGVCTLCGKTTTVIETEHFPYANDINYQVLGTWDYSDATSVNITITYQTEGIYSDWCTITSGTDYIAGSSYNVTRKYLNTSGSIIDATGTTYGAKFGGTTKKTVTFTNIDMLTGSVIFKSDSDTHSFYGITVQITPNY